MQGTRAVPEGLASWLETTRQLAVALRQNPAATNTEPGAPAAWATLVDQPGDLTKTFFTIAGPASPAYRVPADNTPPADPPPVQVGPLLQTTWGQGSGYNDFTPSSSNQSYNYHCPTGCVATAMAQVMRYWRYPSSFDWASMPNSYGSPAVATLMSQCGNAVYMSYKEDSSGADDDYIDDKLKGQYSYRSADYNSSEDPGLYQTVISNLNAAEPVILGGFTSTNWFGFPNGDGHCWVCDGYIQSYYSGNGYLLYSMNWGWDGRYNGWFGYNNWRVTWTDGSVHDYKYAKTYTLNIHP